MDPQTDRATYSRGTETGQTDRVTYSEMLGLEICYGSVLMKFKLK